MAESQTCSYCGAPIAGDSHMCPAKREALARLEARPDTGTNSEKGGDDEQLLELRADALAVEENELCGRRDQLQKSATAKMAEVLKATVDEIDSATNERLPGKLDSISPERKAELVAIFEKADDTRGIVEGMGQITLSFLERFGVLAKLREFLEKDSDIQQLIAIDQRLTVVRAQRLEILNKKSAAGKEQA